MQIVHFQLFHLHIFMWIHSTYVNDCISICRKFWSKNTKSRLKWAQVCLEGQISQESAKRALVQGCQPFEDKMPWKLSQQFADDGIPKPFRCPHRTHCYTSECYEENADDPI